MARTSTESYFLDWIRRFRRPFLLLVLVILGLFVVVPQIALVDSDDDGITDLLAIAIGAGPLAHPLSSKRSVAPRLNSHSAGAAAPDTIQHRTLGTGRADPVVHYGYPVLALLCLLRC